MGNKSEATGEQFHKNCKFALCGRKVELLRLFFSSIFLFVCFTCYIRKMKRRERQSETGRQRGKMVDWENNRDIKDKVIDRTKPRS